VLDHRYLMDPATRELGWVAWDQEAELAVKVAVVELLPELVDCLSIPLEQDLGWSW
jgi:hypothetical protein